MKYEKIVEMTPEEREKNLRDVKKELIKLNAQVATGTPPENPGKITELKRTIARIKTANHE